MNPILEIVIKLLASSALLTAFYLVLFRGKASYRACRRFLLCIPVLSLVFSLVSIEKPGQIFSFASLTAMKSTAADTMVAASPGPVYTVEPAVPVEYPGSEAAAQYLPASAQEADTAPVSSILGAVSPEHVLATAYLTVMLLLAAVILRQMVALRRLGRRAERQTLPGYTVWLSREVRSAFSVMRNIYVNADAPWERLSIIIRHEKEHIARRHYIDLAVMEFFTLLLWFDPFVWIVRRELRNVHEFEADRGALSGGVDPRDYMLAILEETAGVIPVMANGIQSSMIKKRFLKMKTENKVRLRALRVALTVPFAAALMLFFAFRPAAEREIAAEPQAAAQLPSSLPVPPDTEAPVLPRFPRPPPSGSLPRLPRPTPFSSPFRTVS